MARSSNLLPALLLALVLGVALRSQLRAGSAQEETFVPQLRGGALAAAILAASLVAPGPALANPPRVSFFGFGDGVNSDVYSQIDADAYSPYSQYSTNPDYNPQEKGLVDRNKDEAAESFRLIRQIPDLIKTKQSENIKSILTGRTATMRENMEYLSGKRTSPEYLKARAYMQKIADLGVSSLAKQWKVASVEYAEAQTLQAEWMAAVKF
ncbi:unnamed protein product [Polarella glacialis]|uniref:Uncharacterized protein n=1 Tax=Polarella glacialis TaxID=89957 RepID=A0A813FD23_POLGL|nr:unnamed protein product [Polarella glacialis]CAE8650521.1 unnamed protein product [Polarella glacialis]